MVRLGQLLLGLLIVTVLVLAIAGAAANWSFREKMAEAEAAWADISARATPAAEVYSPGLVADLPAIAQRYFNHAIAPGTPLSTTVELSMRGPFLLGDADNPQSFEMQARQILAPPNEFVWIADMRAGPMIVSGADALHRSQASMRFWMFWSIPLVQVAATEGLDRSAAARPALEAIWVPASLLPGNGAVWEELGPQSARVTFNTGNHATEMTMTIDDDGRLLDIVAMRWSDANPDKTFRLQPFGGTMEEEATFGGFTIPSRVHVGNHFGTDSYFPFFNAEITGAQYY